MSNHRTPTVFLLPALLAGGACAGIASAQVTFEFTNSGQGLGNSYSTSVALGDLDGDGDLDAMVANYNYQPNTVWTNDGCDLFTDSGQALGDSRSRSLALGDLDGDGDLDAMIANDGQPNTVWINTVTGAGVCCAPSGCTLMTENLSGHCERLGGTFLPQGSCDDCPSTCPGDINGDGMINGVDLGLLLGAWGVCP
ncbi:MAG: FG-GAP-like repeat-containing protein [Phycisphaerales bacterium]|nr:FG-GAP-like repeat-containing protein [Phycisphaerales bacterium]